MFAYAFTMKIHICIDVFNCYICKCVYRWLCNLTAYVYVYMSLIGIYITCIF